MSLLLYLPNMFQLEKHEQTGVDPDQMSHSAVSDQSLDCLQYIKQYFRHVTSQ